MGLFGARKRRLSRVIPLTPARSFSGLLTLPFTNRALKERAGVKDRKSTRLNSSHVSISYAVFCLKKKKIRHKLHEYNKHIHLEKRYHIDNIHEVLIHINEIKAYNM